ncbi:MAG: T9SS type A sorting domain-containing protein [Bacteroidota bacterium]
MQTIKLHKLFIIALVICNTAFSQTNVYKPFPENSAIWHVSKNSTSGLNYYNYKTSGDTLIGAYTYKKVLYAYNTSPGPFNFSSYTFKFAYRNDSINRKVYYLDVTGGANTDLLWYDFNLNIGDTVPGTFSYGRSDISTDRVVQSIDSVLICGSYHKRFNFNCTDNESDLVEGVGFMDHFVHSYRNNECPFEPVEVYYTGFSTCYFTSVQEHLTDSQIRIFPNPVSAELKISGSLKLIEYAITNNVGETVLKGSAIDIQSIKVSSLSDGLYIIKVLDKSGNLKQAKFIKQ